MSHFLSTSPPPPRWTVKPLVPRDYIKASGQSELVGQLLYNRNVSVDDIPGFLDPGMYVPKSPFLLKDMGRAVERIWKALTLGETIGVFGDFDVDGVTSTIVIAEALQMLGGKVVTYIPNRFEQGHGLDAGGVEDLRQRGASLVITCDCGISDLPEAKKASRMGVDLIITDHHMPLAQLPRAHAVVDPKRNDNRYGFKEFSGVGTAFKVMQAVFDGDRRSAQLDELLELVALGTVADMVSLTKENRQMVQKGLRFLNASKREGVIALVQKSGLTMGSITSGDISWALGPRINASGRLEDATMSLKLLATKSEEEAQRLAEQLDEVNRERQQKTADVYEAARQQLAAKEERLVLFAADKEYPEGVIGLVAGKLSKEFYRPAIVITLDEDYCRGSCRSVPEFDMASALASCDDLLRTFGGHPMAAGFSVYEENLPAFEQRINEIAETQLKDVVLSPAITIDAEVSMASLGGDAYLEMRRLEPFGQHNPEPCFVSRGVEVVECRSFRNHEAWTSLRLKQDGVTWAAVDFRTMRGPDDIPPIIDVVYTLRIRRWNGEEVLQANVVDIAPAS
jgi:single-stranded-DNA-specific exonuclease